VRGFPERKRAGGREEKKSMEGKHVKRNMRSGERGLDRGAHMFRKKKSSRNCQKGRGERLIAEHSLRAHESGRGGVMRSSEGHVGIKITWVEGEH